MMKGIDKVEQDFLSNIQKLTEMKDMKETYDTIKLREIFELQISKHLEADQSDTKMSWLQGTTLDEKFDFFVKRAKDENFLKILDEIPKGDLTIHSYLCWMKNNMTIYSRSSIS